MFLYCYLHCSDWWGCTSCYFLITWASADITRAVFWVIIVGTGRCSSRTYLGAPPLFQLMQKWVDLFCKVMQRLSCHRTPNLSLSCWENPLYCSSMEACIGDFMDFLDPSSNLHISKLRSPMTCKNMWRNQWGIGEMITPLISKMKPKMLVLSLSLSKRKIFLQIGHRIGHKRCINWKNTCGSQHHHAKLFVSTSVVMFYVRSIVIMWKMTICSFPVESSIRINCSKKKQCEALCSSCEVCAPIKGCQTLMLLWDPF